MRTVLLIVLLLFLVLAIAGNTWHIKNKPYNLRNKETALLKQLGDSALAHGDMPISAILLYDDKILASGYNDMFAHNNISGHAEINALESATKRIGLDSFLKLDREKILLLTTWEPCDMCSGAIVQYNIRHVAVVKTKSLKHKWQQWKKKAHYKWNLQTASPDTLQDYLFRKHPGYESQKNNL